MILYYGAVEQHPQQKIVCHYATFISAYIKGVRVK